ncbi:MAG: XisI protein [Saprospiraceae bacterium]
MEKVKQYRNIIQSVLSEYAQTRKPAKTDAVQHQLLFDEKHDHYQLFCVGWNDLKRIYFPVFHLDIQNGKIWVQEDASDYDIVGVLEENGVPKEDIVLAFHAPYKRPYTGYAVA